MGKLIEFAANIYVLLFLVRWVVEGLLSQYQNSGWFLRIKDVTNPVLNIARRYLPTMQGFDFSYIVSILAIKVIAKLIVVIL